MIYTRKTDSELSNELFKNPTSEYRAAPFWAWNCELDKDELLRQIECFKEMGFGGFHMHTRSGMATKYLSDDFMSLVKACTEKAKSEGMLSWLYDEDRWPSGAAGGYVTENRRFRQRGLEFTPHKNEKAEDKESAWNNGTAFLVGIYDIELDESGALSSYRRVEDEKDVKHLLRYAYCITAEPSGWYNGNTYIDIFNPEAVKKFIEITHETYKKEVGEHFGKTIRAIFSDEPKFMVKDVLPFGTSESPVVLPWTPDFEDTFFETYGIDIKEKLPELFWELSDESVSRTRYCYHDHISERFVTSFCDTCGKWCEDNGIHLTGHMMSESPLKAQVAETGDVMRAYRGFGLPGIDMLCDRVEHDTAKQVQSAARQYGKEGVMCEIYGVTGWGFDFRGHKYEGDWLAAMGVTVRVPHLSWASMKGSAKRDYPASISYQAPWYKEYSYIENHFARLATALTRGKSCVNVGVIHPIESYWLHWGPSDATSDARKQIETDFKNVIDWLLYGMIDFDFISEACLPGLCKDITNKLPVGEMSYDTIVVPACETIRKTTLDILDEFIEKGGKVIFAGNCPKFVDAEESAYAEKVFEKTIRIPLNRLQLLKNLENDRDIWVRKSNGETSDKLIYQLREDGEYKWLFIANAERSDENDIYRSYLFGVEPTDVIIKIKGEFTPVVYDTLSGDITEIEFKAENGYTYINKRFYINDSLLLKLTPCIKKEYVKAEEHKRVIGKVDFKDSVKIRRHEENVCILDIAEYSVNGGDYNPREEVLRIDKTVRAELGWPMIGGYDMQPWAVTKDGETCRVNLKFRFISEKAFENTHFCAEEISELFLNGKKVSLKEDGYLADKSIKKYILPQLCKGDNEIIAVVDIDKRNSLEACYLTGEFNVNVRGCNMELVESEEMVGFGDIIPQGMPFYGGNLDYSMEIDCPEDCDAVVKVFKYAGAMVKVSVDKNEAMPLVFEPYEVVIPNLSKGRHTLNITLFGNRYTTFSPLHYCGKCNWHAPEHWETENEGWSYEYNLKPMGITVSPIVTFVKS